MSSGCSHSGWLTKHEREGVQVVLLAVEDVTEVELDIGDLLDVVLGADEDLDRLLDVDVVLDVEASDASGGGGDEGEARGKDGLGVHVDGG